MLPGLLLSIGAGPAWLGLVEGTSDGISSIAKLWGGVATDRVKRRKPLASVGYLVTAAGTAAIGICTSAFQVLLCRVFAWIGRGSRSAPRDYLMVQAVLPEARGRAFGMERAGDALGAVIGPAIAFVLLSSGLAPREIMIGSLLPGLAAFLAIALLVRERAGPTAGPSMGLRKSLRGTGAPFHRFLGGILLFGCGDFSRTLLILYVTQHVTGALLSLEGAALAIALYAMHNAVSALAAFPLGALGDRIGHKRVIVAGYVLAVATTVGFALAAPTPTQVTVLFIASGIYIACQEVAEKAYATDLLPPATRGTGLGLLAAVNGVGDMLSSAMVGLLWSAFPALPAIAFLAAAAFQLAGAVVVGLSPTRASSEVVH